MRVAARGEASIYRRQIRRRSGSILSILREVKHGALFRMRFGPDAPAMGLDDAPGDRQAQARAIILFYRVLAFDSQKISEA